MTKLFERQEAMSVQEEINSVPRVEALNKHLAFVIDDVPFTDRHDKHDRPAKRFGLPLLESLRSFREALHADASLGSGQVVMLHISHDESDLINDDGVTCLEDVARRVIERRGWVVLFTGGDPTQPLESQDIEAAVETLRSDWIQGERFELCDYNDLDSEAIRALRTPLSPDWRVDNLLNNGRFLDRLLQLLTAADLSSGRMSRAIEELRKIDTERLRRWVSARTGPDKRIRHIAELLLWLENLKILDRNVEELPEGFSEWTGELREWLNSPALSDQDRKSFDRERSRLSHSLFGNEFANRLGSNLDFVLGYWRSKEGSTEAGLEDQRESVEGAYNNWTHIARALRAFFEREWADVNCSREETLEEWRSRALKKVATLQDLVTSMPTLAGKPDSDKREWLRRMSSAIAEMQRELERSTENSENSLAAGVA